jgi:methionine synthase I (cobalamin-dependent)
MLDITLTNIATIIAAAAAVVAAVSAGFSYFLSKRIYDEIKSDEMLIAGRLHQVGLMEKDHNDPLVRTALFNKSSRKAFVTTVKVFDQDNQQIPVTWSNSISNTGNIENPTGLLGIVNTENLYIRRNDGVEFRDVSVKITHSFSANELVLKFDPYQGWWQ